MADTEKNTARAYGVLPAGARFAQRTTFVIDKKGVIRKVFPKANAKENAEEVLNWIKDNLKGN